MTGVLSTPLIDGDLVGHSVRYFASPLYVAHREPDMPWHSVDDLWPILVPGRDFFDAVKRQLRSRWQDPRTVATAEGIVTIAPHYMAEGLFEAVGGLPADLRPANFIRLRGRYRNCCTQAMKLMTAHLDPAQKLFFALAAMR